MARQRISPLAVHGMWVEASIRREFREVPGRWETVHRFVLALVERRPHGCPRRRWHRLQRARRMGRLA